MENRSLSPETIVKINAEYWDSVQQDIRDAIEILNNITSKIAAFDHGRGPTSGMTIDYADQQVREVRKLLENIVSPL